MASSPTTRNRLNKQAQGDNINSWGGVLNTAVFDLVDEALDGVVSMVVTGNATLSSANYSTDQARKRVLKLTGSPGASYIITVPSVEKFYIVHNLTNAAQQLKAGGLAASVPSNTLTYVYCDGTDSYTPAATVTAAVGTVVDYAGAVAPSGWLLCYGQAISRVTYSSLFQIISTAHGAGDGSTTFNVPDLRGRSIFGKDDMGGASAARLASYLTSTTLGAVGGSQDMPTHDHPITDAGHVHGISQTVHGHVMNGNFHAHSVGAHSHPISASRLTVGGSQVAAGSGYTITDVSVTGNSTAFNTGNNNVEITTQGESANVSVVSQITGIAVNNRGAGSAGNVPPACVLNKIIYSGV